MKFGLFSTNAYACSYPDVVAAVARAAEAAGLESLWGGEHVVLPDPQAPPSLMAPRDRILDPIIALTYCAAVTTRVTLGTEVLVSDPAVPGSAGAAVRLARKHARLHRIQTGVCGVDVGVSEMGGDGVRPDRGRHDDETQVGPQGAARIECQREPRVGGQAAFVELVEHQRAHAIGGQQCRGRGVDCVHFVAAVLDELLGRPPRNIGRRSADLAIHDRRAAVRTAAPCDFPCACAG